MHHSLGYCADGASLQMGEVAVFSDKDIREGVSKEAKERACAMIVFGRCVPSGGRMFLVTHTYI